MPIIQTETLKPGELRPENHQIYNGLDCCLTFEIFEEIQSIVNDVPIVYDFERALQAPALEMMMRGFRIDQAARRRGIERLREQHKKLDKVLQAFAFAVWDKPLNPRSPDQLKAFFYGAMRVPEQWISQKGVKRISVNRESLEKVEHYFHPRPIVACILEMRDIAKQLEVLETEVDPDGRMRTSYNIAATETGRWSSSKSSTNTGRNIQNIDPALRFMFIADKGKKLCGIDLEQAESREVGWQCGVLFDDWAYLDAAYGGDLHTTSAKLIWPDLAWTGNNAADRKLAEEPFYRHFSRRDMSKRGGHGSNYRGSAWTMARHLKVPVKLIEAFQEAYYGAFTGIPKWHDWTDKKLRADGVLVTPWGRQRHFFGRASDPTTLREAIAFVPQSSTADRMNIGLWRIWKYLGNKIQLLAQVHDAVYFQYDPADEHWIVPKALELIDIRLTHGARQLIVPGEAKVGWNWANYLSEEDAEKLREKARKNNEDASEIEANPYGLMKYKGSDSRTAPTNF